MGGGDRCTVSVKRHSDEYGCGEYELVPVGWPDEAAVERGAHELDKIMGSGYTAKDLTTISRRVLRAAEGD